MWGGVEWLSTPAPASQQRRNASSSSLPLLPASLFFSLLLLLQSGGHAQQFTKQQQEQRKEWSKLPFRAKKSVTVSSHGGGDKKASAAACMTIMAWHPLPQSGGGAPSAGDEFFLDDQSTSGWPLWSWCSGGSSAEDDDQDHGNHGGAARVEKHGDDDNDAAGSSVKHTEGHAQVAQQQQRTQPTDDIFMSQFSDEEMRRMDDAPFEALDMFPGSMHQLLSYENMLSGVLTGSSSEDQQQDATLGVDTMDTCGFPLFSHDLTQNAPPTVAVLPDLVVPNKDHQDGVSRVAKRSRSSVDNEESLFFEALVLQDLKDVVFQKLTKRTRVCFRDAFFRLAESSRAKCSAANGTPSSSQTETGLQQASEGNASRISTPAGCPERETNAIDRTVADLTMKPPHPVPLDVLVSRCAAAADDSGAAEAQSGTSSATWTTTA